MRIIDADQLTACLKSDICAINEGQDPYAKLLTPIVQAVIDKVDKMAENREHGEWIETEMLDGTILYECSCCSHNWLVPDISEMHFCPTCGAKLEGEYE